MLIGREQIRAWALSVLAAGRSVAVTGVRGAGCTTVLRDVAGRLDPDRYEVASAAASEAARQVPFGALAGLFPDRRQGVHPAEVQNMIAGELVRRAGRRTPVLVLDDAQCLDGPSAGVLLGLAVSGAARLLVAAHTPAPELPDAIVMLWKDGHVDRHDLAAFDRPETAALSGYVLGGAVAEPTVDLLWQWTGGNPLFLTEVLRHGRDTGQLVRDGGLWWWRGDRVVPPVLVEFAGGDLHRLGRIERDVLALVALGEPVPVQTLETTAGPAVVAELEDSGLLRTEDDGGRVVVRLRHPLTRAAVHQLLTPARRRRAAATLLATVPAPVDGGPALTRRALWQLATGDPVDAELMVRAAGHVQHADPHLAVRLARRAFTEAADGRSAVALASALIEAGDADAGRQVLVHAGASVPAERGLVAAALAGHRAWVCRDPDGAHRDLVRLWHSVESSAGDEIAALDALVLLSGGHTGRARERARPLTASGSRPAALRARLVEVVALTLTGRTTDAAGRARELVAEADADPAGLPYLPGMARAALALADLWRLPAGAVPMSDPAVGRWPALPGRAPDGLLPTAWPLFDGYARRISGDRAGAITQLRAALVQQSAGEALFRSEAAAWLAISLADDGQPDAADAVLARHPPDRVAVVRGLGPWAAAAIAAARGDTRSAAEHLGAAIDAARVAGATLVELGYLVYAAQLGRPAEVADRLAELAAQVDAPRLIAAAQAALALARHDPDQMLSAAVRLDEFALRGQALSVAEAAQRRGLRTEKDRQLAAELITRLRERLRAGTGSAAPGGPTPLTAREGQIAVLAGQGMSDREIAERLVLSVRTVETHLARTYRKLGVASRRHLAEVTSPGRAGRRAG